MAPRMRTIHTMNLANPAIGAKAYSAPNRRSQIRDKVPGGPGWRIGPRCAAVPETMDTVLVSAAVVVESGRVLLTQRKAGGHLAGKWEFPGGKVEEGEDPRHALARELEEE